MENKKEKNEQKKKNMGEMNKKRIYVQIKPVEAYSASVVEKSNMCCLHRDARLHGIGSHRL